VDSIVLSSQRLCTIVLESKLYTEFAEFRNSTVLVFFSLCLLLVFAGKPLYRLRLVSIPTL